MNSGRRGRRFTVEILERRELLAAATPDSFSVDENSLLEVPAPGLLSNDVLTASPVSETGDDYFVAPQGSPGGDGSLLDPWDLQTALDAPEVVDPGDNIWLLGGTYRGAFASHLYGTVESPIDVQAFPGQHVRIDLDDPGLVVAGDYTNFIGFEVFSSDPSSRSTQSSGSHPSDMRRGEITVRGSHNKFINLVVHDLRQGFGFWSDGAGGEIYGSIIYNNGWLGPDRGHGHGIYSQNGLGTKVLSDNIVFNQYGAGIHIFGSSNAPLRNYEIVGNTVFNDRFLVGGGSPAANITLDSNLTYAHPVEIGYVSGAVNEDVAITNNYFADTLNLHPGWESITFQGNSILSGDAPLLRMPVPGGVAPSDYVWDSNEYISTKYGPFVYQNDGRGWASWQALGFDATSVYANSQPSQNRYFVRPNQYQAGRATVVAYNWESAEEARIDLSQILTPGSRFQVHHVYDLFGEPLVDASYDGQPVSLPLVNRAPPPPIGGDLVSPAVSDNQFAVFVVTSEGVVASTTGATSRLGVPVSVASDGSFSYDPRLHAAFQLLAPGETRGDDFRYQLTDNEGRTDTATVTIEVSGRNDLPEARDDLATTEADEVLSIDVLANDDDPDESDIVHVVATSGASDLGADLTINADGSLGYDPTAAAQLQALAVGDLLIDRFQYTIEDRWGERDTATVTVRVNGTLQGALEITLVPDTVLESDGNGATEATIRRLGGDTSAPLTVSLVSSDPTEALVASSVVIPADQDTASFRVDAVDDALRDGDQWVELQAAAAGHQSASTGLTVRDDESAATLDSMVIDNGDSGFRTEGQWRLWSGQGWQNDVHESLAGDGAAIAQWRFPGLPEGNYRVSVTWSTSDNRATNAPFTVFDGALPRGTTRVDQRGSPDSYSAEGSFWQELGVYQIDSGTLAVELSDDADGRLNADAVRIESVGASPPPEQLATIVDDGDAGFDMTGGWRRWTGQGVGDDVHESLPGDGASVARWTFAGLQAGAYRVAATWTASSNRATDAPVTILDGSLTLDTQRLNQQLVPASFTADSAPWQELGIFQVESGVLVVELSDDANGRLNADAVRIQPVDSSQPPVPQIRVIDNGDSGFSMVGDWRLWTGQGLGRDVHESLPGNGSQVARWTFPGLPAGTYRVSATWSTSNNRATNAPFTMLDGPLVLATRRVNQKIAPDSFTADGSLWAELGDVQVRSGVLVVELSDDADGRLNADAIRVELLDASSAGAAPPPVTIIDNGGAGFSAGGEWQVWTGQGFGEDVHESLPGSGADVARWTFTGLEPGTYRIAATWSVANNRATDAPFTILDGSVVVATVRMNQQLAADDFSSHGLAWEELGVVQITGSVVSVELSDDANGRLNADAILIQRVS